MNKDKQIAAGSLADAEEGINSRLRFGIRKISGLNLIKELIRSKRLKAKEAHCLLDALITV